MKNKSFTRLLFGLLGSAVGGNVLALVVTVSLAGFSGSNVMLVISSFCSLSCYFICIFGSGYNNGELEKKLERRGTLEKPNPNKWFLLGFIICVIMWLPCIYLIINPAFLQIFRFIAASVFALSLLIGGPQTVPVWVPFVFMGIYLLTPLACRLGYYAGYNDKLSIDSIVYKKRKK